LRVMISEIVRTIMKRDDGGTCNFRFRIPRFAEITEITTLAVHHRNAGKEVLCTGKGNEDFKNE